MAKALDALVELLDLEAIEVDVFRGLSPDDEHQRVFGGQVAGQALVAAGRTVSRGTVHSLHAYFLRPGDPAVPILYQVDRIRDGRSFTTRRVVAVQHGRAIFNLSASFHVAEAGPEHQVPMPDVPAPDSLPTLAAQLAPWRDRLGPDHDRGRAIDVRYVTAHPFAREEERGLPACQRVWMRADGELPDDPLLHACVVAYASDLTLLDTTLSPHGISALSAPGMMLASLDHVMWFHRPFRADDWLLYEQESPSAHGARGFARARSSPVPAPSPSPWPRRVWCGRCGRVRRGRGRPRRSAATRPGRGSPRRRRPGGAGSRRRSRRPRRRHRRR